MKHFFSVALICMLGACATKSDVQQQRSAINETIKANQEQFLHCFKDHNDRLTGKILLWFIVEPQGSVKSVTLKESTLDNPMVEQCMMKEVMSLKFKAKMSTRNIEITYPFKFTRIDQ